MKIASTFSVPRMVTTTCSFYLLFLIVGWMPSASAQTSGVEQALDDLVEAGQKHDEAKAQREEAQKAADQAQQELKSLEEQRRKTQEEAGAKEAIDRLPDEIKEIEEQLEEIDRLAQKYINDQLNPDVGIEFTEGEKSLIDQVFGGPTRPVHPDLIRQEFEAEKERLQKLLKQKKAALKQAQDAVDNPPEDIQELDREIEELDEKIEEKKKEVEQTQNELEEKRRAEEAAAEAEKAARAKFRRLRDQKKREKELSDAKEEVEEARQAVRDARQALQDARRELTKNLDLARLFSNLFEALDTILAVLEELGVDNPDKLGALKKGQAALDRINEILNDPDSTFQKVIRELLRDKVAALQKALNRLKRALQKLDELQQSSTQPADSPTSQSFHEPRRMASRTLMRDPYVMLTEPVAIQAYAMLEASAGNGDLNSVQRFTQELTGLIANADTERQRDQLQQVADVARQIPETVNQLQANFREMKDDFQAAKTSDSALAEFLRGTANSAYAIDPIVNESFSDDFPVMVLQNFSNQIVAEPQTQDAGEAVVKGDFQTSEGSSNATATLAFFDDQAGDGSGDQPEDVVKIDTQPDGSFRQIVPQGTNSGVLRITTPPDFSKQPGPDIVVPLTQVPMTQTNQNQATRLVPVIPPGQIAPQAPEDRGIEWAVIDREGNQQERLGGAAGRRISEALAATGGWLQQSLVPGSAQPLFDPGATGDRTFVLHDDINRQLQNQADWWESLAGEPNATLPGEELLNGITLRGDFASAPSLRNTPSRSTTYQIQYVRPVEDGESGWLSDADEQAAQTALENQVREAIGPDHAVTVTPISSQFVGQAVQVVFELVVTDESGQPVELDRNSIEQALAGNPRFEGKTQVARTFFSEPPSPFNSKVAYSGSDLNIEVNPLPVRVGVSVADEADSVDRQVVVQRFSDQLRSVVQQAVGSGVNVNIDLLDRSGTRRPNDPLIEYSIIVTDTSGNPVELDVAGLQQAMDQSPELAGKAGVSVPRRRFANDLPSDPMFHKTGSWGESYHDQWALRRIALPEDNEQEPRAWAKPESLSPTTVAVIGSGVDWTHPELFGQMWINEVEDPYNGIDDDRNGFVDDLFGWNFLDDSPNVMDHGGHDTHIAGVIAARWNNDRGIAGVNPSARIMALKTANFVGHSDAVSITKAIYYAARNGADVINISYGGKTPTPIEKRAMDEAASMGILVVLAAGNQGEDLKDSALVDSNRALTVAGTTTEDQRAGFSNWGQSVDLAAPAMDVLSLRAQSTDFLLYLDEVTDYQAGTALVGGDRQYYRASGTSFAAPFVSGAASLLWSQQPDLELNQIRHKLLMSARDIDVPGWDQNTGVGRLDLNRAGQADPDEFVMARISQITPQRRDEGVVVGVHGIAHANSLKGRWLQIAFGKSPDEGDWKTIEFVETGVDKDGELGVIPGRHFDRRGTWTLRILVQNEKGTVRQARATLNLE